MGNRKSTHIYCAKKIRRVGFTLIELLIVVAIIAVLMGLIIPAVMRVRSAAEKTECQNNLKQMGLALLNYESDKRRLPVAGEYLDPVTRITIQTPHSFFTHVLPYVEQKAVYDRVNFALPYNHTLNDPAFVGVAVKTYLCPSNPARGDELDPDNYGATDYAPLPYANVHPVTGDNLTSITDVGFRTETALGHKTGRDIGQISDGASNSLAVYEDVGRSWRMSASRYTDPLDGAPRRFWRWAEPDSAAGLSGVQPVLGTGRVVNNCRPDLTNPQPPCDWRVHDVGMNNEPFSFHLGGGAHVVFCDGHVTFIDEKVSALVMRAIATHNGSEPINHNDLVP